MPSSTPASSVPSNHQPSSVLTSSPLPSATQARTAHASVIQAGATQPAGHGGESAESGSYRPADLSAGPGLAAGRRRLRVRNVAQARERRRLLRLLRVVTAVLVIVVPLSIRVLTGHRLALPHLPHIDPTYLMTGTFFLGLLVVAVATSGLLGRSPHVVYRPGQIKIRIADVKGLAPVSEDIRRTLDVFLGARTFRHEMGGNPRRGILFEGPPGTGKTHMAKAMAAEAGVPFLFVAATSFQSMYYGASARKIRAYFKALRKAALAEGGAIGFIEEIDAIAGVRGGLSSTGTSIGRGGLGGGQMNCGGLSGLESAGGALPNALTVAAAGVANRSSTSEGVAGVVNELLVQMQSFDTPSGWQRVQFLAVDTVNLVLPAGRRLPRPRLDPVDILVIAATNRADSLDPALLRPGRFDRRLSFDLPDKAGRRELIDHFLGLKAHELMMDDDDYRDALAGVTQGYSPVQIEHLMDEALINAVRRKASGMSWSDLEHARMVTEVGLGQPVGYTDHEQRLIATHEAGHAVCAYLLAPQRRLEILTIIKRAGSLGLLAHGDREDVYTRSQSELEALIGVAFGGQVAEELFFGEVSTGPSGDLAYATTVAAQMIGAAGMDGTLMSFAAAPSGLFGGGDLVSRVMGDSQGRRMMESLLNRRKADVRGLLDANRHLIEALRDALLQRHELIGREIEDVLRAAQATHRAAA